MAAEAAEIIQYDIPLRQLLEICQKSLQKKYPNSEIGTSYLKKTSGSSTDFVATQPKNGQTTTLPEIGEFYFRVNILVKGSDVLLDVPTIVPVLVDSTQSKARELDA